VAKDNIAQLLEIGGPQVVKKKKSCLVGWLVEGSITSQPSLQIWRLVGHVWLIKQLPAQANRQLTNQPTMQPTTHTCTLEMRIPSW